MVRPVKKHVDRRQVALDELERRKLARTSFKSFVQYTFPRYQVRPHNQLIADAVDLTLNGKINRLMVFVPAQYGKALSVDTPIATPNGWSTIGRLKIGDKVFGSDGKPITVTAKSEVVTDEECYTIETDDQDTIVAGKSHLWHARYDSNNKHFGIRTTEQLYTIEQHEGRRILIRCQKALQLPKQKLIVDPYVLGFWLGDGSKYNAIISQGGEDAIFIRQEFEKAGYTTTNQKTKQTFGVLNLQASLKAIGVLKNKHIPMSYLRANYKQRLALLQGLVDSDGYVAPHGQIEIVSIDLDFALQIKELVNSMGRKAQIYTGDATLNGKFISKKYRVCFYLEGAARLLRKQKRTRNAKRYRDRYISISPCATVATQCIQVSSSDGMFLAGKSMLPTHNSELVSRKATPYILGRWPDKRLILVSYAAELATDFSRDARNLIDTDLYQNLFPHTKLAATSKGVSNWNLEGFRGGMYSSGVGGGITGHSADGVIIDDPIRDEKDAISPTKRDGLWEWYWSSLYTRISPNSFIILCLCMTGDTPVLMGDGSEQQLQNIKIGDKVATFDKGKLTTSTVLDHRSNGLDFVLRIKMTNGKIVHANKRHPFLVMEHGQFKWIQAKNLKLTHKIVTLKDSGENGKRITSDFTITKIESIEFAGMKEVFDLQVERTENFIANGLVSHNTRWHEDDLAGRLLIAQETDKADKWHVLRLPALGETSEETQYWCDRHFVTPEQHLTRQSVDELLTL